MKRSLKKLASIILIIILLLALAAPAAAAQASDTLLWQREGFESAEEFMDYRGMGTAEGYSAYIADETTWMEWDQWFAQWKADNAELVDSVMSGEYPYWEYYGCNSLEEFIEWYGFESAEDAAEFYLQDMAWYDWYYYRMEKNRAETLEAMGGTYGIINVMYNGSFIKFTDVVPEMVDDRTMLPYRALFEAFGAAVNYDEASSTVTGSLGGVTLSLVIGESQMTVTENGESRTVDMDSAAYIKNGRTYIPARAVSEALGFDVFWDSDYKAVVIINLEKMISDINENFTIMNRLLDTSFSNTDGTYKTTLDVLAAITQFNTIDGDTLSNITANIIYIYNGQNFSITGSMDISDIFRLYYESYKEYMTDEEIAEMEAYEQMLENTEVEIIMNADEDKMYIRSVLLSELITELEEGTWVEIGGISEYYDLLNYEIPYVGMTMGDIIFENSDYYYYHYYYYMYSYYGSVYNAVFMHKNVMDEAGFIASLLGDGSFKRDSGKYTLDLTMEDYNKALKVFQEASSFNYYYYNYSYYDYAYVTELDVEVTIGINGGEITGISGSVLCRDGSYYDTRYTAVFDISASKMEISLEIHEKNEIKVEIEIGSATDASDEAVPASPPAGDKVITIEELIYGPPPRVVPLEAGIQ